MKTIIKVHIFPNIDSKDSNYHIGETTCPCKPHKVYFKNKCFYFHKELSDKPTEYPEKYYSDLPESYKIFVNFYKKKLLDKNSTELKMTQNTQLNDNIIELSKEEAHKGISRIDFKRTHGWFVRVYKEKKVYNKLFSDLKCGGKEKALKKALNYRNKLRKELGLPDYEVVSKKTRKDNFRIKRNFTENKKSVIRVMRRCKRTKTGVIGIYRSVKANGYQYYVTNYCPKPNERKRISFSIDKHGEEKAFEMAFKIRERFLKEIFDK